MQLSVSEKWQDKNYNNNDDDDDDDDDDIDNIGNKKTGESLASSVLKITEAVLVQTLWKCVCCLLKLASEKIKRWKPSSTFHLLCKGEREEAKPFLFKKINTGRSC